MCNIDCSNLYFIIFFNKLLLLLLPAIVGGAIYRDYKSNFHSILYTYPFSKADYLPAKFIGGFSMVLLIALASVAGLALGTQAPGVRRSPLRRTTAPPTPPAVAIPRRSTPASLAAGRHRAGTPAPRRRFRPAR